MEMQVWKEEMKSLSNKHQELENKLCELSNMYEAEAVSCASSELTSTMNCEFFTDSGGDCCYGESSSFNCDSVMWYSSNLAEGEGSFHLGSMSISSASHSTTSLKPPYPSFSYIPSFTSHCVRLPGQEEAFSARGNIFKKLEKQYQEERSQCKQS